MSALAWPQPFDGSDGESFWFAARADGKRFVFVRASNADRELLAPSGRHYPWRLDPHGYPCRWAYDVTTSRGRFLFAHRLVARASEKVQVDHIHHDLLDVRRSQLRLASPSQNAANTRRGQHPKYTTIPYRGVTFHKQTGRFQAACHYFGRHVHLGLFDDSEKAAKAYDRKALELWGHFATLNFPGGESSDDRAAA